MTHLHLLVFSLLMIQTLGQDLWPLITPLCGDISDECRAASNRYIENLNSALSTPFPSAEQQAAMKMFDSNGPTPFLQEGILQSTVPFDICNIIEQLGEEAAEACQAIPVTARTLRMPFGHANAPGAEGQCKDISNAQYCHNYFSVDVDIPGALHNPTQAQRQRGPKMLNMQMTQFDLADVLSHIEISSFQSAPGDWCYHPDNVNTSSLIQLSEYILERNGYIRSIHTAMVNLVEENSLLQTRAGVDPADVPGLVAGLMVLAWWVAQAGSTGSGYWTLLPQLPYQGMCYPAECSSEDINKNNVEVAKMMFRAGPGTPFVRPSPIIPEFLASFLVPDADQDMVDTVKRSIIGCSGDERHSGDWSSDNVTAVAVFSVVGFFIVVGTLVDTISKESKLIGDKIPEGLLIKILKAFSLTSNLEFIFKHVDKKGSGRLDCLEGMRAISMTWVILGHNFAFGAVLLHVRNYIQTAEVQSTGGSVFLEAIKQGQFSVDTFLFIGATLLSYLLLKDLDKSNGWFHGKGVIRMFLFYLNRILRLTIPYAFVLLVFIGLIPLIITEPIASATLAQNEAHECSEFAWKHLLYINIFGDLDACLGHTWYLSCDMIFFILSPLVVYPLWRTKFSKLNEVIGLAWWSILMGLSFFATLSFAYLLNEDLRSIDDPVFEVIQQSPMPPWNFSPLGYRNQCYLFGLLMGYILHRTKDKKIEISRLANILIWCLAAVVALCLVYGPHWIETVNEYRAYLTFHKFCWGLVLSWVTFACIKGYGGVVNDLLSWGLWIPISKISFMTYLFHMSFNFYYHAAQGYNVDYTSWLLTEIFVPQLFVCLFIGLIATVTLELPFGKIQKLLIEFVFLRK